MAAPEKSADFDDVYRSPISHWVWSDPRIPAELEALSHRPLPGARWSSGVDWGGTRALLAQQGVRATGVDFSPVAIAKARERVAGDEVRPEFIVGDVTDMDELQGSFDLSFDVGCFHCLAPQAQRAYVSEVSRLLKPGATHLMWALDATPSDVPLSPAAVEALFAPAFTLQSARKSRRRLVRSHWYWLTRTRA